MKKIFIISVICFLLTSCINIFNKEEKISGGNGNGTENHNTDNDDNKGTVLFENKSKFAVNVYLNLNPYMGDVLYTIPANDSCLCELKESSNQGLGDVFYIEYLIKIGNAVFPYWTKEASSGYKTAAIKKGQTTNIEINELTKCESKSAYLLIENNSASEIRVNNGKVPLKPYASKVELIAKNGACGVYEVSPFSINEPSSDINLGNLGGVKIKVDVTNEIALPVGNDDVIAGNIYTISVNTDDKGVSSASLKAITPFNIDTQKKIWAFNDNLYDTNFSICMRPSYDKKSTIIMGTPKSDYTKVGFVKVDEYKNQEFNAENFIAYEFDESSQYYLVESEVVDFIEQEDGSVVFLVSRLFTTKENVTSAGNLIDEDLLGQDYVISSYDFRNKKLYWYSYLTDMFFRNDSKNKLVPIGKDKYILVGANYSQPEGFANNAYGYELVYVDASNPKAVTKTIINSMDEASYDDAGDGTTAEKERSLTSAYYDGTNLYFCGYENWEPKNYSTTHVGKIWKTTVGEITGKTFKFTDSSNVIYSHENCLFFSMDGIGSNFVVCGEYRDTGKILKGCFVSSREIAKNAECEPVLYVAKGKKHCWFNQLCQYNDKVVLCGIAGDDFGASVGALPFVVAYDYKNNKLWENLSFSDYTDALNIIPNTIGTYMLQLSGKNGIIHYVNADLLGNEVK